FAGPAVAHSIFPGLPGRAVAMGDRWVDTVAYSDDLSGGEASQRSITEYTVVGDAVVEGRSLVEITFKGTSDSRQTMALQGAEVRQETLTEIEGHVLWDVERGLLFEREMRSVGTGTVRVALAPGPLPTRVESRSRVRLQTQ
ncbi:MAG TPA: hypothetical protein VLA09_05270, partial [Longimicrobiales bacterium]|nr:hypothetical protein [Longimicrobiales bacterium]